MWSWPPGNGTRWERQVWGLASPASQTSPAHPVSAQEGRGVPRDTHVQLQLHLVDLLAGLVQVLQLLLPHSGASQSPRKDAEDTQL